MQIMYPRKTKLASSRKIFMAIWTLLIYLVQVVLIAPLRNSSEKIRINCETCQTKLKNQDKKVMGSDHHKLDVPSL